MSKFNEAMIDKYADKLLIGLTKEENQLVLDEFDAIDKHIDLLNDIEGLSKVSPMTHCLDDFEFTLRSDEVVESIPVEEILKNSGRTNGREIEVPKVVG